MSKSIFSRIPEFYSEILLDSVTSELVANHSKIAEKVILEEGLDFKLNLVRIFLNRDSKKSQKCYDKLIEHATSIDLTFGAKKKGNELRAITGIVLLDLLSRNDSLEADLIGLALRSGSFLKADFADAIHREIEQICARNAISKRSPQDSFIPDTSQVNTKYGPDDMGDSESIDARFVTIEDYLFADYRSYLESLELRLRVLEEESNIQWYLFRGFSPTAKKQFKSIDKNFIPWVLGSEISQMIRILPEPPSAPAFIEYGLYLCSNSEGVESTIMDFVNVIPEELLGRILEGFDDQIHGSFCPILFAAYKRNESDRSSWVSPFEKATSIEVATKVTGKQLAFQVLLECLFVRELRKLHTNDAK